jgi:hypothetical protein
MIKKINVNGTWLEKKNLHNLSCVTYATVKIDGIYYQGNSTTHFRNRNRMFEGKLHL